MPRLSAKSIDFIGAIAEDQPFAEEFLNAVGDEGFAEELLETLFQSVMVLQTVDDRVSVEAFQRLVDDIEGIEAMVMMDSIEEGATVNADVGWLVFFEGRRTGVAVAAETRSQAISKARKRKKRGGEKVVSARKLTAAETKTAAAGKWIKSRPPGFIPSMRGKGPKPNAAK
jgi:hypothetical protein